MYIIYVYSNVFLEHHLWLFITLIGTRHDLDVRNLLKANVSTSMLLQYLLWYDQVCSSLDMSSSVRILSILIDLFFAWIQTTFTRYVFQSWPLLGLAIRDLRKYWSSKIPFLPRILHRNQCICSHVNNCFSEKKHQAFQQPIFVHR